MRFGSKVLFEDVISTTFSTGRRYGLTGPNGSGKSTFMKLLTGESEPQRGTVVRPRKLACVAMDNFDPAAVTKTLVSYGLKQQDGQGRTPLVTYISLRMPNRGGAEGGTPELYLTDPDGLAIQLQDVKYCGGGGFLGEACPPLPPA